MEHGARHRRNTVATLLAWSLVSWLTLATTASWAAAQDGASVPLGAASDEPGILTQILHNLFNSRALLGILAKPELSATAFVLLNTIVFIETGLLIGFFLPGDSLLVTAGMACYAAHWSLPLLLASLCISAIVGDSVGYAIGFRTGPKIFNREKSWFFNKEHLLRAHAFYEKHGGKTIIIARFMPIIRTFAPVVAGVGGMDYRKFLFFNVIGGAGWVSSMILLGFSLPIFLNRAFQDLLGNPQFDVQDHIEKVVILVVLLSVFPGIYVGLKTWLKRKPSPAPPRAPVQELAKAK